MPLDLYYMPESAPCRAVLLAGKLLDVDFNLKLTDLLKGEHLSEEYIKINSQHTIPTLVDDGFVLWESRPIMTYLADQHGKDDGLYPKEPKQRALVDQRLYFDVGTLYGRFADYYYPVMFGGAEFDAAKMHKIKEAFSFLEGFLENEEFVAGSQLTLADLSILATVTTYEAMDFDLSSYENVAEWLFRVKDVVPDYEGVNGEGALLFRKMADNLIEKY